MRVRMEVSCVLGAVNFSWLRWFPLVCWLRIRACVTGHGAALCMQVFSKVWDGGRCYRGCTWALVHDPPLDVPSAL